MEIIKKNLYLFLKIFVALYIVFFLVTNMTILFFSDTLVKYSIIKFDSIFESSSPETITKLNNILSKYSIEIKYNSN